MFCEIFIVSTRQILSTAVNAALDLLKEACTPTELNAMRFNTQ